MITSRARAGQGAVAVIIQAGIGVKCEGVSDGNGDNEDARARVPHSCDAADALLSPDNKTHNPVLLQTLALTNSHSIISI